MFSDDHYEDQQFHDLDLASTSIEECEFDTCRFRNVVFNATTIKSSRFVACTFDACDLALIDPLDSVISASRTAGSRVSTGPCRSGGTLRSPNPTPLLAAISG